jgi:hypothetical protein
MRKLDDKDLAQFAGIIIGAYLQTGKDQTAAELAGRSGWPLSKVRRYLTAGPGGAPPDGVRAFHEARTSYSRDFPGMEAGVHRVTTYGPTREKLRDWILMLERIGKRNAALKAGA